MLSSTALLAVVFAQLFALSAARDVWLQSLPRCWQSCFANTDDGCSSTSCVCETSTDSAPYLSSAVSCAVSKCDADHWALDLTLGSLELLCAGIGSRIPKDIMDDAYGAASESDSDDESTQSTRTPARTTSKQKTAKVSNTATELTSTIRSTFTTTTTDSNGNTLQIVVPIVIEPTRIVTGALSTSRLRGQVTSTETPASAPTSLSPEPSLPSLMLLPASTSAPTSQRAGGSVGGSGSPFDASTGARQSTAPGALLALGAFALLYMRM